MSLIRFLHVDHLRLGSPLTGLSDCPEWLARNAEHAVRKSVCNMVESAIARHCDFVLIAGSLTEAATDLQPAIQWLSRQTQRLSQNGIRLIVSDDRIRTADGLALPETILLDARSRLEVTRDAAGSLEYRVCPRRDTAASNTLSILVENGISADGLAEQNAAHWNAESRSHLPRSAWNGNLIYVAEPATCGLPESHRRSVDGFLRMTAGSPQSLQPSETGAYGGRVVEVSLADRQLEATFIPLDVIRYVREHVRAAHPVSPQQLRVLLKEACEKLPVPADRTQVLDCMLHVGVELPDRHSQDLPEGTDVDERLLLSDLRRELRSGHSGIWPRRIRFSDDSRVVAEQELSGRAVLEFLNAASERTQSVSRERWNTSVWPGTPLAAETGVTVGLTFLEDAA
ncbi:MAG: hypothetical protein KDA96_03640 [Planctomycetaceae bacterium]|nr:hypothetical protein [Planctomycetaceae bacterium]